MASRILRWAIGLIILGLIGANLTIFSVREGQVAVVTHFGKVDRVIPKAGWYSKWFWPIDEVHRLDARKRIYRVGDNETLSRDRRNIIVWSYVVWAIDKREPGPGEKPPAQRFLESLKALKGSDEAIRDAEAKLYSIILDGQNAVLGSYDLGALVSSNPDDLKIDNIQDDIVKAIEPKCQQMGIEVHQFGFERLAFPEDNAKPALGQMKWARQVEASGYRVSGEKEARRIKSEADLRATQITAEASGRAAAIRGKGDAVGAGILLEAHRLDPPFYRWFSSLEALKKMFGPEAMLILDTKGPVFDVLKQPTGPEAPAGAPTTRPAASVPHPVSGGEVAAHPGAGVPQGTAGHPPSGDPGAAHPGAGVPQGGTP